MKNAAAVVLISSFLLSSLSVNTEYERMKKMAKPPHRAERVLEGLTFCSEGSEALVEALLLREVMLPLDRWLSGVPSSPSEVPFRKGGAFLLPRDHLQN